MVVSLVSMNDKTKEQCFAQIENASNNSFIFDKTSIAQNMVQSLSSDFNIVLYICGFIVLLFLTISFGRFELSLIAFLPMLISWIWILGIMVYSTFSSIL